MARHYLYEAANVLLTTVKKRFALRSWGLKILKTLGPKKARVAVARTPARAASGPATRDLCFSVLCVPHRQIRFLSRLDRCLSRATPARRAGKLFKILDCLLGLSMVAWPCRKLAIAQSAQFPLQGDGDVEFLPNPLC